MAQFIKPQTPIHDHDIVEIAPVRPKLWLAVHECGHAVAKLALDELPPYPGPFLRSVSIIAEPGSLGRVDGQPRVAIIQQLECQMPDDWRRRQRQQLRYDIVEGLAGWVAELYQKGGPLAPLLEGKGILGHKGIVRRILSGEFDADSDFHSARQRLEWLKLSNPLAELSRLWDCTYGLIACEWQGLKRISRVLLAREFMDGVDFEAEWAKCRSTAAARRQTEKRLGQRYGEWRTTISEVVTP